MSAAESRTSFVDRAVQRLVDTVTGLVVKRPRRMLLVALLLVGALVPGVGRVKENFKYHVWFQSDDPKIQLLDQFEQRFGSDLASILVVHSPSGIFDRESAQLVVELTDRMWKVAETIRVESLSNFSWVHADGDELVVESLIPDDRELTDQLLAERKAAALAHEQLPGFLVSKDGKTALIYGYIEPTKTGPGANRYNDFVANRRDLLALVDEFEGRGDHQLYLTGFPIVEGYLEVEPPREMQKLMPIILGTCVLLLFLFFRRPSGVVLPLALAFPSVLATLGIAGWTGIPINPITITCPNIMVIIAISSADHLLFSYFQALDNGSSRADAVRHAYQHTAWPTFFSCLMVGVGFLSLVTMTIPPLQQLGVLVAAGTLLVWLLLMSLIGPLLVILPIRPRKRRGGVDRPAATAEELAAPKPRALRFTAWVDRYKFPLVGAWAALLGLSLWLAGTNRVAIDPIDWYAKGTEVRTALDFVRQHIGVSESFEIIIESGKEEGVKDPGFLRKVDAFGGWLARQKGVVQVTSVVDIIKDTNRALFGGDPKEYRLPDTERGVADEFTLYTLNLPLGKSLNDRVTLANDALRMTVFTRLETSPAMTKKLAEVKAKAEEMGLEIQVTGRNLLYLQVNDHLVPSFFRSMLSGTLAIALILLVFFRSVRLGLLSLVTNFVPIVIGAGVGFYLLGKTFDMSTIGTFVIALGVSVDDTIHFLDAYARLRRQGVSRRMAVAQLWSSVGPPMLFTTLVLVGCFGLFVLITFPVLKYLGVLIAMVLVVAFLADFVLGPALLLLAGRDDDSEGE